MDLPELDAAAHRKLAATLFNATWDLLDKSERSPDEDAAMLGRAHASRHHWAEVARLVRPSDAQPIEQALREIDVVATKGDS